LTFIQPGRAAVEEFMSVQRMAIIDPPEVTP